MDISVTISLKSDSSLYKRAAAKTVPLKSHEAKIEAKIDISLLVAETAVLMELGGMERKWTFLV